MRRRLDSAMIRRDTRLDRTRKLSVWIAGGAAAACVGLATLLGTAIPGRAANSGSRATTGQASSGRQPGSGRQAGSPGQTGSSGQTGPGDRGTRHAQPTTGHGRAHGQRHILSPPSAPPSQSTAPPVVSSGGS